MTLPEQATSRERFLNPAHENQRRASFGPVITSISIFRRNVSDENLLLRH